MSHPEQRGTTYLRLINQHKV